LAVNNRRANLEDWLDNEIMPWFRDRVLPFTLPIAERWGELSAQLKAHFNWAL
jgi:predicted nucleic acid-binding protein